MSPEDQKREREEDDAMFFLFSISLNWSLLVRHVRLRLNWLHQVARI
jgi:hypothetical protein